MTRITYKLNQDGQLISNLFILKDGMGFIIIDPKLFSCDIRMITNDEEVYSMESFTCKSLDECKSNARTYLINIGVVFQDEVRTFSRKEK